LVVEAVEVLAETMLSVETAVREVYMVPVVEAVEVHLTAQPQSLDKATPVLEESQ
jgi:hypothetical protein